MWFQEGPLCGTEQCMGGWECCLTCNEYGTGLIAANYCESTLDGYPGCPIITCVPGIPFNIAVEALLSSFIIYQRKLFLLSFMPFI